MSHSLRKRMRGWPDLINVALGCWLYLSPFFLLHFEDLTSSINAYLSGAAIAVLAGYARQEFHLFEEALVGVAALWLVVSPWALGFSGLTTAGTVNAVLTGLAVLGLAAWSALVRHEPAAPEAA